MLSFSLLGPALSDSKVLLLLCAIFSFCVKQQCGWELQMAYLLSQSRLLLHMGILRPPLGCLSSDLDSQLSSYSVARNHMQRCTRVLKRAVSPGPRPTVTAHLSVPQRVFFPRLPWQGHCILCLTLVVAPDPICPLTLRLVSPCTPSLPTSCGSPVPKGLFLLSWQLSHF